MNEARENYFKGNITFQQPINFKNKTSLILRLFNLYPAHQARVKEIKILDLHMWKNPIN